MHTHGTDGRDRRRRGHLSVGDACTDDNECTGGTGRCASGYCCASTVAKTCASCSQTTGLCVAPVATTATATTTTVASCIDLTAEQLKPVAGGWDETDDVHGFGCHDFWQLSKIGRPHYGCPEIACPRACGVCAVSKDGPVTGPGPGRMVGVLTSDVAKDMLTSAKCHDALMQCVDDQACGLFLNAAIALLEPHGTKHLDAAGPVP